MRVAQVIGRLTVGGAERHFVSLVNALDGVEREVILLAKPTDRDVLLQQIRADVPIHIIPQNRWRAPSGILRLARFLRQRRYDVIHSHMFWPNLYATAAAALARTPVVITTEHGENRWKRGWHRWLERAVISRVAGMRLCVSPQIFACRRDIDGVPAGKLGLMENGTSVPPKPCGGSETGNVIGSVGRFVPQKNFPLLVEAIGRLSHLGHYPTLCLVGDGPEMPTIRAAIQRLGMTESVLLPGMQMDVQSWLCRFDIFASSSNEEGQPIALLEAMAGGLPCVATDVGGVSQTLDSGLEGLLVPPRDADAMASAIASLLEDAELRRRYGLAARERVRRQFSIDAVAHRHVSLYRQLLSERRVRAVGAQL